MTSCELLWVVTRRLRSCGSAKDFGIDVGILDKWLREERVEAGEKPGATRSENMELRELR